MKSYLFISFSLLIFFACCTNKSKNDFTSEKATDSTGRYIDRVSVSQQPPNELENINDSIFQILRKRKNSQVNRNNLSKIVGNYDKLNRVKSLDISNKVLFERSLESEDSINIAKAYFYFGNSCLNRDVGDSAYYFYLKAEKLFKLTHSTRLLSDLYLNKSTIQLGFNDYLGAESSASQSLKYSRLHNNILGQYDAYTNLGIASHGSENYSKAIEYHSKALKISRDNSLHSEYYLEEISENNIGNCYQNLKKFNEAIRVFERALDNKMLYQDKPSLYATLLDNLAYCQFKLKSTKNYPELFQKALKIRDSLQLYTKVIYSKIHLSEYYYEVKDTLLSQKYANEALLLAHKTRLPYDLLISLKQISVVDQKKAAYYSNQYIRISDSLQIEERKAKDKFARVAFETDEIIQEKDKLAEQNRSLLYFFVGTLFVGLLLFVIRTQRAKNRELMLKQQQQKANEEIYSLMISQQATIEENRVREKKRIAQELHDGVLGRLFGARLNLDSLNRSTDEESINSRFNYLNELKNIEQDIREISHDLNREKHALINNFVAIVQNLLEEQSSSFEPELTSSIDEKIQWDTLENNTKINLYRILQESLQNINKYAQAKHIHVEFKTDGDNITLKVTDDGIGFEVDTKKRGIGLQNMLSRTSESEGTFEVQSQKGKGTTVTVSVPLVKKQDEA